MDLGAIEAWRAKDGEYATRVGELEVATAARDTVRGVSALRLLTGWGGGMGGWVGEGLWGLTLRASERAPNPPAA